MARALDPPLAHITFVGACLIHPCRLFISQSDRGQAFVGLGNCMFDVSDSSSGGEIGIGVILIVELLTYACSPSLVSRPAYGLLC